MIVHGSSSFVHGSLLDDGCVIVRGLSLDDGCVIVHGSSLFMVHC